MNNKICLFFKFCFQFPVFPRFRILHRLRRFSHHRSLRSATKLQPPSLHPRPDISPASQAICRAASATNDAPGTWSLLPASASTSPCTTTHPVPASRGRTNGDPNAILASSLHPIPADVRLCSCFKMAARAITWLDHVTRGPEDDWSIRRAAIIWWCSYRMWRHLPQPPENPTFYFTIKASKFFLQSICWIKVLNIVSSC